MLYWLLCAVLYSVLGCSLCYIVLWSVLYSLLSVVLWCTLLWAVKVMLCCTDCSLLCCAVLCSELWRLCCAVVCAVLLALCCAVLYSALSCESYVVLWSVLYWLLTFVLYSALSCECYVVLWPVLCWLLSVVMWCSVLCSAVERMAFHFNVNLIKHNQVALKAMIIHWVQVCSECQMFFNQGHISAMWPGFKLLSSEILCLSWLSASFIKIWLKVNGIEHNTKFYSNKVKGDSVTLAKFRKIIICLS